MYNDPYNNPNQQQPYQQYPEQPGYQQPMYAPMQPPKKKSPLLIILLIAGGLILVSCVACGLIATLIGHSVSSNTSTLANSIASSVPRTITIPTQAPATTQHAKVGDVVTVNSDWKAIVNSVTTDNGGEFSALKSGDIYIVLDVSLTNTSSKTQTVSTLLEFSLKDSTGQKYDETIDTNVSASLGGDVEPGGVERGTIVYEVPTSQKNFTLAFEPDILGTTQTIWNVSVQ